MALDRPPEVTRVQPDVVIVDDPLAYGLYVSVGGGGADAETARGGAVTGGVGFTLGPLLTTFNAFDVILYPGDTFPYVRDPSSNGDGQCRDSRNGQFADSENCVAVGAKYALSFDTLLLVPRTPLAFGGGRRFDDRNDPWFVSAGLGWMATSRRVIVVAKGNFGTSYISGLVTVAVRVAGG
jgi:hypothetical protein